MESPPPRPLGATVDRLAQSGLVGLAALAPDGTVLAREGSLSDWLPRVGDSCFESPILAALDADLAQLEPAGDPLVLPGVRLAVAVPGGLAPPRFDILITRTGTDGFAVLTTIDHADRPIDHWVQQQKREQRLLEEKVIAASRDLEAMNANLRQFTTMAAHDLQAPLRQIAAFARVLRAIDGAEASAGARDCIDTIETCAGRLHRMISSLLDFARLSRDRVAFGPVDLGRVVEEARQNLAVPILETGAVVEIGPLPSVNGSFPLLVSLFQNLLANSLRHRSAAPPHVAVAADGRSLSVTDNGIGIPAACAESVFESFVRLDPDRSPEGVGLGLSMARRIAEIHRWHLSLDTAYDRGGARFRLDLDLDGDRAGERRAVR